MAQLTKTLTFDEKEWYELYVLLLQGIEKMETDHDADDVGAKKWIERYRNMIKQIDI